MGFVHQRLNFHQARPRAFLGDQNAGTRNILPMLGQKQGRRIAYLFEARSVMAKTLSSFTAPKRFFAGADQSEARMGVAFKIEHRIDDVFEDPRQANAPSGNVADEDDGDAQLLCQAGELGSAFANLGDRTGSAGQGVRP